MIWVRICRCWSTLNARWLSQDWWLSRKSIWIGTLLFCAMFWGAALGLTMWILSS